MVLGQNGSKVHGSSEEGHQAWWHSFMVASKPEDGCIVPDHKATWQYGGERHGGLLLLI